MLLQYRMMVELEIGKNTYKIWVEVPIGMHYSLHTELQSFCLQYEVTLNSIVLKTVLITSLFLLTICPAARAEDECVPIPLDGPSTAPDSCLRYLEPDFNIEFAGRERILQKIMESIEDFRPLSELKIDKPQNESEFWIYLPVKNHADKEQIYFVELTKGYFWKAYLFVMDAEGGLISEQSYSELRKEFNRAAMLPWVSFPFHIGPQEEKILLLRLKAYDIRQVPLRLIDIDTNNQNIFIINLVIGIFFGILFGLFIYNTALFYTIRETWLLHYLSAVVTAALYILTSNRIINLSPDIAGIFAVLTIMLVLVFTRSILQTVRRTPVLNAVIAAHLMLLPLPLFFIPFNGPDLVFEIHDYIVITSALTMVAAGITAAFKKEKLAAFYLPAFLLFCFGVITNQLERFGIRFGGLTFLFANAEQPGFVFSLLILALAISIKIKDLRSEKIHALEKAEQMELLYREKVNFFTVVSHELRTPTANLKLFIERILKGHEGTMIPAGHRMFTLMQQQIQRIGRHIDNILSISKAEQIQNDDGREPADIRGLCARFLSEFEEAAKQKNLLLRFEKNTEEPVYAEVNRGLFESMMINVIDNSIKYTDRGSISLSVYEKDDTAVIELRDTGRGIAKDDVTNVFKRFYTKGDKDGFGIGLSVVHDIVKLHDGSIELESSPGAGSILTICLPHSGRKEIPLPKPAADGKEERPSAETGKDLPNILLVEDDINLLESMAVLLSTRFRISKAPNAREAMQLLEINSFDLIVCDILMPGMNGFEFLQEVRKNARTAAVPFLFLTALGSHENRLQGLRLGAIDYIRKPFDSGMLTAKITAILESKNRFIADYDRRFKEYLLQWKPEMPDNGISQPDEDILKKAAREYNLTEKQTEIFQLVIKGYTNRDIGRLLNISKKTVDNHLSSILKKTGVSNRTQLSFELLQIK